jgi:hypothetical protein
VFLVLKETIWQPWSRLRSTKSTAGAGKASIQTKETCRRHFLFNNNKKCQRHVSVRMLAVIGFLYSEGPERSR